MDNSRTLFIPVVLGTARMGRMRSLPVMRGLGLVPIFWEVNFSSVQEAFSAGGQLLDESNIRRSDKKELIWMAKTLRHGREQISLD